MINVLCSLWGTWPPRTADVTNDFQNEYVYRLKEGVERNLSVPHRFICFADRDVPGIETWRIKSPSRARGASRGPMLTVYNPKNDFKDLCLVLDLDSVIVGNLDDIRNYKGEFCSRSTDRWAPPRLPDGDGKIFRPGSKKHLKVWEYAVKHRPSREGDAIRGSQIRPDYWYEAFYKGYFLSYKYDLLKKTDMKQVKNRMLPSDAKIVSFHGGPKQHKVDEDWLKEHWGSKLSYSEPKKKSRRG